MLIVYVGIVSIVESQQFVSVVKCYGFDVVFVVMFFYYFFSFEEYCDYYWVIIDFVDGLLMVVYNILVLSGVKFIFDQINMLVILLGVSVLK